MNCFATCTELIPDLRWFIFQNSFARLTLLTGDRHRCMFDTVLCFHHITSGVWVLPEVMEQAIYTPDRCDMHIQSVRTEPFGYKHHVIFGF